MLAYNLTPLVVLYIYPCCRLQSLIDRDPFLGLLNRDYINWLDTEEGKNQKLLGPKKHFDYCYFLQHPDTKSILEDIQDCRQEANKKFYCLKYFELQDNIRLFSTQGI
jgi:hypothetical protein